MDYVEGGQRREGGDSDAGAYNLQNTECISVFCTTSSGKIKDDRSEVANSSKCMSRESFNDDQYQVYATVLADCRLRS